MKIGWGYRRIGALMLVVLGASVGFAVSASGSDHERAMQAMQAGDIKPLTELLALLSKSQAGRVVEVELEQKHGRWVYEFKLLEENGMVRELKLDARNGEIVQSKYDDQ